MAQLPSPVVAVWLWVGLAVLTVAIVYLFEWRPRPETAYESDREQSRPSYRHDPEMLERPSETQPVRELTHDEYDPVGTAILIGFYFVVISALWLFMYFVEFLGSGPTVVG